MKKDIIVDFAVFIEGNIRLGAVIDFTPPPIALQVLEHQPGGTLGVMDVDIGIQKLVAGVTFAGHAEDAVLLGREGDESAFTCRGALVTDEETVRRIEYKMSGLVTEFNPGQLTKGASAQSTLAMTCHRYEMLLAGVSQIKIDVRNDIFELLGVDQREAIRDATGR